MAEEIARQLYDDSATWIDIKAALHEYGQAVRDRDAEIAQSMMHDEQGNAHNMALEDCAAAISKEPLP